MVYKTKYKGGIRYKWNLNYGTGGVNAQDAGEFCEKLSEQGKLTPKNLVNESRDENAVLHRCFEWDDTVAAEEYREHQAMKLMTNLVTIIEKHTEEKSEPEFVTVKAFHNVPSEKKYISVRIIMNNEEKLNEVLSEARKQLANFRRKYATLSDLKIVFDAIDEYFDDNKIDENDGEEGE